MHGEHFFHDCFPYMTGHLLPPQGARRVPARLPATLLFVLAAAVLASCGGGGGGGGSGSAAPVTATAAAECPSVEVTPIRIDTQGAAPILSKDDYVDATLRVGNSGEAIQTRIRGRGNSTWIMPKKPYRLKLDKKTALLGMAADKDWALLANYSDKTLMRNSVAFCMSRILGMAWTPDSRYVELTLNGDYVGSYQLTEHVKTGADRVDIGEESTLAGDPGMGFLLEIDARLDEVFWFNSTQGVPYTVKSDLVAEQLPAITDYVAQVEAALFGPDFTNADTGYEHYLGTDSLIDMYLINELMRNTDAFASSTFAYRPRGGKLHFGPAWDFDIAAGNVNYSGNWETEGWWVRTVSPYVPRLQQDPQFERRVKQRWAYLASRLPELHGYISATARALDGSQQRNFERWPILDSYVWPNAVVTGSYADEVRYLADWLSKRAAWMDTQLSPEASTQPMARTLQRGTQAMMLTPPSTYSVSPDRRRAYGVAR